MDHPLVDSYGQPWITEDIPMGGVSKNKHIRLFNIWIVQAKDYS